MDVQNESIATCNSGSSVDGNDLPQDWPGHLSKQAVVEPISKVSPAGEVLLDFAAMPAVTFEQLCWWLLTKDQVLHGCQRLGVSGSGQGGIDLFAYDDQFPGRLNVYECKAWKNFDVTSLSETVSTFLNKDWAKSTRAFTLILAQQEIGTPLARRWHSEKQRLKAVGIEGELWVSDRLTQQVQAHPDIISKFFPGAHVEAFGNIWMQRVNFFETVSKAVFDPRPAVAEAAKAFIAESGASVAVADNQGFPRTVEEGGVGHPSAFAIDGVFRRVSNNGRHWLYRGPWFSFSVMLPDQHSTGTSAAFDFNQGDLKGVTITVGNDWLLKRFLFSSGAPLTNTGRAFIVGPMLGEKSEYLIDLPSCRLNLGEDVVQELADVADLLTEVMRDELKALENNWSAIDFPFVDWSGTRKVALACLRKDVWAEVCSFAEVHDYEKGNSQWNMFDGHPSLLRPWHRQANDQFEEGYHALISSSKRYSFSSDDEVTLLWQPDDLVSNRALSPRGWWSCQYAFDWFNNELLPEVKRFILSREYGGRLKRLLKLRKYHDFSSYLDYIFVAKDVRKQSLVQHGLISKDIVSTVKDLQSFFAGSRSQAPYLRHGDVENLYRAIVVLASGSRGYLGYIAGSLSLEDAPKNHTQLIGMVNQRLDSGLVGSSVSEADYALRAMLELLNDTDDWLTETQLVSVKHLLLPLARVYDDALLVERHTAPPQ
ncbi:hypothetical protein C8K66_101410 [Pseudomonas sp. GV105]|uniref:hypothetical protein n=1 Tax=Pseudomonas sp. GV105 TaxID=2135759 RepID=UPI000D3B6ED9|nr:hypothetical protein [Pseudomonas sp. GV105]PUB37704.1 hypothetical protein C8K66_101410 [Pseudomonas sp. GV105]